MIASQHDLFAHYCPVKEKLVNILIKGGDSLVWREQGQNRLENLLTGL